MRYLFALLLFAAPALAEDLPESVLSDSALGAEVGNASVLATTQADDSSRRKTEQPSLLPPPVFVPPLHMDPVGPLPTGPAEAAPPPLTLYNPPPINLPPGLR